MELHTGVLNRNYVPTTGPKTKDPKAVERQEQVNDSSLVVMSYEHWTAVNTHAPEPRLESLNIKKRTNTSTAIDMSDVVAAVHSGDWNFEDTTIMESTPFCRFSFNQATNRRGVNRWKHFVFHPNA